MFRNSVILITGGTGSWGNTLIKQLIENYNPREIRVYSRGEHKQVEMSLKYCKDSNVKFIIGDVRDKNILDLSMNGVDYVFHLAALKHVPVCENNTWEAVLTNIYGTQNVIECSIKNKIKKVVFISTDKAVDPYNHYGVTKSCAEKMIANASFNYISNTKFVCIRCGNILETNGSVIPLFKSQILENNYITITDSKMTRYLMNSMEAISLALTVAEMCYGGEIFVINMPATTVDVIAKSMMKLYGNEKTSVKNIGIRKGEKMDEVLISKNETPNTKIIDDTYFAILPNGSNKYLKEKYKNYPYIEENEFNSRNAKQLSEEELVNMLKE